VTQDNQGKKTPGVDGIAMLEPQERQAMVADLYLDRDPQPVLRIWIPKPGTEEKRPLGIPMVRAYCVSSHGGWGFDRPITLAGHS
jgi:RNA-directed DNA polymerase